VSIEQLKKKMKQTDIKTDVPLLVVCFFRINEPNLVKCLKKILSFSSSNSAEQKKIRGFFYARRVSYANNYLSHLIGQLKVQFQTQQERQSVD
jgi:hypothetical protein